MNKGNIIHFPWVKNRQKWKKHPKIRKNTQGNEVRFSWENDNIGKGWGGCLQKIVRIILWIEEDKSGHKIIK